METKCIHSCKGLCNALGIAEKREQEAIDEYRRYAGECDYPDVRLLLERLIAQRQQALDALRETRSVLEVRFATIDRISDSFA
jgi:rubrerythrin